MLNSEAENQAPIATASEPSQPNPLIEKFGIAFISALRSQVQFLLVFPSLRYEDYLLAKMNTIVAESVAGSITVHRGTEYAKTLNMTTDQLVRNAVESNLVYLLNLYSTEDENNPPAQCLIMVLRAIDWQLTSDKVDYEKFLSEVLAWAGNNDLALLKQISKLYESEGDEDAQKRIAAAVKRRINIIIQSAKDEGADQPEENNHQARLRLLESICRISHQDYKVAKVLLSWYYKTFENHPERIYSDLGPIAIGQNVYFQTKINAGRMLDEYKKQIHKRLLVGKSGPTAEQLDLASQLTELARQHYPNHLSTYERTFQDMQLRRS